MALEETKKALKRGRREGSLGILTFPAMKTNASWRVEKLDQNKPRIMRMIIYVHSNNNISLSLGFILFTIKGLD